MSWNTKNCKFCGQGNLYWEKINNKWFLLDYWGNKHVCKKAELKKAIPVNKDHRFKNDPLIKKALREFKRKLNK